MPPKKSQKRPAADEATTPRLQKRKIDGKDVAQPQVLINVNMVTKTGESSLTHCITLNGGSFNKDTVTLKNIRQLLIKEKALTLSRYGCAFCTPEGAQIGNQTSFVDYLSLLGQAPAKKEDQIPKEGSPEPESDLPADPEKEVDPSGKGQQNFTEYNIYLQEKKKYEINKDVLGLIKDGVDVKPGEAPKLPDQDKIEHLSRLYDASKVIATSGGELPNPAQMSEKDWHAVARMNSLLNAHRFVFTQPESDEETKTQASKPAADADAGINGRQLIFRRIEKAPYSAFEIAPRTFGLHEVSNDVTKSDDDDEEPQEISLRIPRFIVADDSYVDTYETQSSVQSSMAQSSFAQTEVEAGAGGGAFGFSAAVSAGFSHSQTNALASGKSEEQKAMNVTYNFPRVIVHLDPQSVTLTTECRKDLQEVINSQKTSMLLAFHQRYGHFFATRVELGGRLFSSEKYEMLGTQDKTEASQAMKASAKASFSSSHIEASSKASHEDQDISKAEQKKRSLAGNVSWQAQGGNTLLCNNPPEWVPTVAPFLNWRVVKQEDVVPLAQFIGQIPGFGHVPREFKYITDVDKKLVNLDIKFQLVSRKGASDQYLSFPDDPEGHDLSKGYIDFMRGANPGSNSDSQSDSAAAFNAWSKACGEMKKKIKSAGISLAPLKVQAADESSDFQVEVGTYLAGMPTVLYNHWYKLYNKKLGKYVTAFKCSNTPLEFGYTAFGYGDASQAIFFKFISTEGKVNGVERDQVGELAVISQKDEEWGKLSLRYHDSDAKNPTSGICTVKQELKDRLFQRYHEKLTPGHWKFQIN
ncbi:uncharacterized protein N7469_001291 [Penicillium citrinum]|uniref:MACPF-like domain-containing protein n=1 Tax=Penicillium citrinum TaxID=5077 RepID=A0A9W9TW74_PENCI|nr:uncharacterized protein N7469_001291 [Penicillium citrinum]KAJ5242964.1 hypothetical protein N7469_001291 [Penicillium citrinum]